MTILNKTQTVAELREYAKENGMTFKEESYTISNQKIYKLINRKTKKTVITNLTLQEAYGSMITGRIYRLAIKNDCIKNTREPLINELVEELEDFKKSVHNWISTKHQEFKYQVEYIHIDGYSEEMTEEAIKFFGKEVEENKKCLETLKKEFLEKNTKEYLIDEIIKLIEEARKEVEKYIGNIVEFYKN
ncbi:hypothetical protein QJU11_09940 [Pasteurella atlantica]|uniref:hypothetical protein n=1 Tax=Phocoenobacter atlanticus TaxID=3416742 RepID=UPI002749575C|nr:hypothetical protein [Pasteurella atlantica]MDP8042511.1 hypothetical protein [Pasteurella atlantica]